MPNPSRTRWLAFNYAATIFISAFLLFQVQPLVSKYILPWFGGSPAVWTTCLLFFQSLLFAGYAYAHFSAERLSPRGQAVLHLAIILTALVFVLMGVVPSERWKPQDSTDPVGHILLLLGASIGLPYFVLSTTGPLVQSWFAKSLPGRSPYRLYSLSNIGSLLALLSYPVFFERVFDVHHQALFWGCGFVAFAVLCSVAASNLWNGDAEKAEGGSRKAEEGGAVAAQAAIGGLEVGSSENGTGAAGQGSADAPAVAPHWWQRALWLVLPALASITLLATTNHVCTDVAVMPFLWVIPLSLYLVTFIVAFDHPRWYKPTLIALVTLVAIYWVGVGKGETDLFDCGVVGGWIHGLSDKIAASRGIPATSLPKSPEIYIGLYPFLAINFLAMFGICLLCHGELVRQKPHPRYLTAFYLLISAGGALGGITVTLIAPQIFKTYYEWELTTYFGYLLSAALIVWALVKLALPRAGAVSSKWPLAGALAVLLTFATIVGWIDLQANLSTSSDGVLLRSRNFFGTLSVSEDDVDNSDHFLIFKHGATVHGLQFAHDIRRVEPTTYYTEFGGVGRAIDYFNGIPQAPQLIDAEQRAEEAAKAGATNQQIAAQRAADKAANLAIVKTVTDAEHARGFAGRKSEAGATESGVSPDSATKLDHREPAAGPGLRIGAVGLGAGTLASYAGPGDVITFYEINPAVIDIADNGKPFTFLSDCKQRGAKCDVKLGDARLTIERELNERQPKKFDLLVLDAFSGDAIPAHLLTDEAFQIYMQRLASAADGREGAIAIHITNHHVDLEPVVRALAEKFGLKTVRIDIPRIKGVGIYRCDWMILTRNQGLLDALAPFARAPEAHPKPTVLWTDAFSNLFDVLK